MEIEQSCSPVHGIYSILVTDTGGKKDQRCNNLWYLFVNECDDFLTTSDLNSQDPSAGLDFSNTCNKLCFPLVSLDLLNNA